jgi:hypothetical protein
MRGAMRLRGRCEGVFKLVFKWIMVLFEQLQPCLLVSYCLAGAGAAQGLTGVK